MKMEQTIPKRRYGKFRCRGNTQKKEYNKKPPALLYLTVTGLAHNRRTAFHVVALRALDLPIVSQFKRRFIYRHA
jgi:hypothetical protein